MLARQARASLHGVPVNTASPDNQAAAPQAAEDKTDDAYEGFRQALAARCTRASDGNGWLLTLIYPKTSPG